MKHIINNKIFAVPNIFCIINLSFFSFVHLSLQIFFLRLDFQFPQYANFGWYIFFSFVVQYHWIQHAYHIFFSSRFHMLYQLQSISICQWVQPIELVDYKLVYEIL